MSAPGGVPLEPQRTTVARHLLACHPRRAGIYVGGKKTCHPFVIPDELDAAVAYACTVRGDCYFTPGCFNSFEPRNGSKTGRVRDNVPYTWCVWVDVDNWTSTSEAAYKALRDACPDMFRTRSRPGANRFQVFVPLDKPIVADEAEKINRRLVATLGGDPAPTAPNALMRLAGTYNCQAVPRAMPVYFEEAPRRG